LRVAVAGARRHARPREAHPLAETMSMRRRLAAVALLHQCGTASGWVRAGHEQINRIAEQLLVGKRRDQVRTMLHEDLFEAGGWELAVTGKYPDTDILHWHHQSPEWTCSKGLGDSSKHIQCDGHGAEQGSLFCALVYFFDQFAHSKLLEHYAKPKEPVNTPSELQALAKVPKQDQTSTNFLRWLVILLGDLHQPLHWLRGSHDYGRQITVTYQGLRHTLLDFWEEYLPKHAPAPKAADLQKEFNERAMTWDYKTPPELFRDWARESAEMACEIYQSMEVNHADGSRAIDSPFEVNEEMYKRWVALWTKSATRGGERIAFMMQNVLEHRRHKTAHHEGRGHRHHRIPWEANLASNAAIACIVVPAVLLLLRWHSRLGARFLATSSKAKS